VPEYAVLWGSGKVSVVALVEAGGATVLVPANATAGGRTGASGALIGATGTLVLLPEQPATRTVSVASAPMALDKNR
jgi:hypothetical protein